MYFADKERKRRFRSTGIFPLIHMTREPLWTRQRNSCPESHSYKYETPNKVKLGNNGEAVFVFQGRETRRVFAKVGQCVAYCRGPVLQERSTPLWHRRRRRRECAELRKRRGCTCSPDRKPLRPFSPRQTHASQENRRIYCDSHSTRCNRSRKGK